MYPTGLQNNVTITNYPSIRFLQNWSDCLKEYQLGSLNIIQNNESITLEVQDQSNQKTNISLLISSIQITHTATESAEQTGSSLIQEEQTYESTISGKDLQNKSHQITLYVQAQSLGPISSSSFKVSEK